LYRECAAAASPLGTPVAGCPFLLYLSRVMETSLTTIDKTCRQLDAYDDSAAKEALGCRRPSTTAEND
jgi:hypothetical protein